MKITVLVDNNTFIDRYFLAEPGLSFFIEEKDLRVLFDVGYSDVFIRNAQKLKIDLLHLDYLVFSHGHLDHTWGIDPLIKMFSEAVIEKMDLKKPTVIAHEKLFQSVTFDEIGEFSTIVSKKKLSRHFTLNLSRRPVWLSDHLVYLGEIPRKNAFESKMTFGQKAGETQNDSVPDDSALACKTSNGLVIITGCSHSGICNIVEYAKAVCGETRIWDIIGGLHLMNPSKEQLEGTMDYIKGLGLKQLHACHCTDLYSKIALSQVAPIKEVGAGLQVVYP